MRKELLLGASILALLDINSGRVHAQNTVVTVAASGSACNGNPVNFTDLATALASPSVKDNYTQTLDVQICPGTYTTSGAVDFNGTLEGVGTATPVIELQCQACQNYLAVGDINSPAPGVTALIKNIEMNGTVVANGDKVVTCIQVISGGYVRFEEMDFENCENGVLADRWVKHAQSGYGVMVVADSTFNNNCGGGGPEHGVYLTEGWDLVGGTIDVPGAYVSPGSPLTVGETILPGDTVTTAGTLHIVAGPNHYGECEIGYNVKLRPNKLGIIQGNTFVQNFTVAASGAIDDAEGSTLEVIGNSMTFGPQTGLGVPGQTTPSQGILIGDLEGMNNPQSYIINGNNISLSGVTVAFGLLRSLTNSTNVLMTNNTLPPASELVAGSPIVGLGTIGAGNVDQNGTAFPQTVQNTLLYTATSAQDFRGQSGPQTASPIGNQVIWGGNGVLTVNGTVGTGVIGGPGGVTANMNMPGALLFTDPASPLDTINVSGATGPQLFSYGTNEILNFSSIGLTNGEDDYNIMPGSTAVVTETGLTPRNPTGYFQVPGGNLTVHSEAPYSDNHGMEVLLWPGAVYHEDGLDSPGMAIYSNGGTAFFNDVTIAPSCCTSEFFTFELDGGVVGASPKYASSGGTVTSFTGFVFDTYDDSPGEIADIKLEGTISESYTIAAVGGGTIEPGDNLITVTGNSRSSLPLPPTIAAYAQSAAAGSSIAADYSPVSAYNDGSGSFTISRANTATAPISVELDVGGTGTIEVTNPGTVVSCTLNGVAIASKGVVGANYVITSSAGGSLQLDGTSTPANCETVGNAPASYTLGGGACVFGGKACVTGPIPP